MMLLTGRGSGDLTSFRKGPDRVPAGGGLAHHELPEVCALLVFPLLSPSVAPANYSVGTRPGNTVFRHQTRFEPHPNVRGLRTEHVALGYRIAELDVGTLKGRQQILEATQSLRSLCTEEALAITADSSLNIRNRVSAAIDHHCGQILDATANRMLDVACCRAHRSVGHNNLDSVCLARSTVVFSRCGDAMSRIVT